MGKIQEYTIKSEYVPNPRKYSVLLPNSYKSSEKSSNDLYPLMLILHGGGGSNKWLNQISSIIIEQWEKKLLPEMIFVCPDCDRSFYMDYRDGSESWETFIIKELLPNIRKKFRVSHERKQTIIGGVSMGGMGSLRMGLKHLDLFGAIISIEPAIEPAFEWKDIKIEDKFYRDQALFEKIFGKGENTKKVDESYWRNNNPSYLVKENPDKIRESGIRIYIAVGVDDMLGLFRGAEFIHRILFDSKVKHEFKMIYGADHVGKTTGKLLSNGILFLNRILSASEPDPVRETTLKYFNQMKKDAGIN
ncbi:MAG: alpha/beta hydrolase [Promethearchaeota archaeon]